jgi:cell division protein FtsB
VAVTVRFLAQELYRLTQKVEDLEAALSSLEEGTPLQERARLEAELLQARKERDHCRSVLDAKKDKPLV